jgi:hypothetical protein
MMAGLLRSIATLDEAKKGSATREKVYSEMAKTGRFDPDAGSTFTQLVKEAKYKGFVLERIGAVDGVHYLELSMQDY